MVVLCIFLIAMCPYAWAEGPYAPTWESLSKHSDPEWFKNAKFGIYTHWGPVTVGSENAERGRVQWYGMGMYQPDDAAFQFHRETFGDQNEFGYKDVVPLFKAEKLAAKDRPCEHAFALKLTGFEVAVHPDARLSLPGAVAVPPEKVTLEGSKVRVQDKGGRPNIGAWDNPKERCHWLVHIPKD